MTRDELIIEIDAEILRANWHGVTFTSLHEAYAVILEELDEIWDITRQKRRDRNAADLKKELVQLAAMTIKALGSMPNFIGGNVMTHDKKQAKFIIELDEAELAVRLLEAAGVMKRPPNRSAAECLDDAPEDMRNQFRRMAQAAIIWFGKCTNKGIRPS